MSPICRQPCERGACTSQSILASDVGFAPDNTVFVIDGNGVIQRFNAATKQFERLYKRLEAARIPILVGIWPFENVIDAEFMANEVPGVRVPDHVLERMRGAKDEHEAAAQGIAIARETLLAVRGSVSGVHIAAPGGHIDAALAVLEGIGVPN